MTTKPQVILDQERRNYAFNKSYDVIERVFKFENSLNHPEIQKVCNDYSNIIKRMMTESYIEGFLSKEDK